MRGVFEEFELALDVHQRVDQQVCDAPFKRAVALGRAGDWEAREHSAHEVHVGHCVEPVLREPCF